MKHLRRILFLTVIVALGALAYVVAQNYRNGQNSNGPAAEPTPKAETPAVRVCVQPVQPRPMTDYILLPGTVEAWEDIDLGAKAAGTVEHISVEEGDRVASGGVILRLDTATLVARVQQAQAQLDQARKHFERTEKLVRDRVMQPAELDNALAQRDVAQATLDVAQTALENATLHSPVPGVVDRLHLDVGEYVHMGDPVAKIVQTDRVKVVVNVPEKDIGFFDVGQEAGIFRGDIDVNQMIRGTIYFIALTANPVSRTYPLHVEVANPDNRLRPGMIVRVGLVRRQIDDALAVPMFAIVDRADRKVVFVEENGRAVERPITLGVIEGNRIQVTSGLQPGDRLICIGHRDLVDGEKVEVVPREEILQEAATL